MKLQRRYALLPALAASLILAACGGGDGEGDYSDTGSGGNSGGTPDRVAEDWKEYKTISPRCPMGASVQQDNIHCLRGVFRGKSDYGQACEVDFMGENGFRLTVDGNPYTYLPNAALKLDEYNHYTSNQYLVDSLIAEKQLYANLNYTPSSTVIFDLVDGKYDANHWRRLGKDQDVNYVAAFVLFTHFPKEMGASLNIPGAGFETNFTCRIESVLYH